MSNRRISPVRGVIGRRVTRRGVGKHRHRRLPRPRMALAAASAGRMRCRPRAFEERRFSGLRVKRGGYPHATRRKANMRGYDDAAAVVEKGASRGRTRLAFEKKCGLALHEFNVHDAPAVPPAPARSKNSVAAEPAMRSRLEMFSGVSGADGARGAGLVISKSPSGCSMTSSDDDMVPAESMRSYRRPSRSAACCLPRPQ